MNNPKKYNQAEEEILMVNENLGLETTTISTLRVNQYGESAIDATANDMDVPSLQYSLEELNDRITMGIEQYQRGVFYSQEDAHTLFDQWKKRTLAKRSGARTNRWVNAHKSKRAKHQLDSLRFRMGLRSVT